MDIEEIINNGAKQAETEGGNYEREQNEESVWEEEPQTETQPEPPKKAKRKLKPLAVIAVILIVPLAGIIVFKTFVQTKPAAAPAPVKANVFPGKLPSLFLKAESKAALKVKTPVAGKAEQTVPAPLLAGEPKTTLAPAPVPLTNGAPAGKRQVNKPNNLNDLFKLKTAPKPPVKTFPQAGAAGFPGQVPAPNFNGIPPNVLQNIKSKINGGFKASAASGPRVLGVSNNFAVVRYEGADLYLKSGDSFGNCMVLYIGYNNVKISCGKVAKSYPVEFQNNKEQSNTEAKK